MFFLRQPSTGDVDRFLTASMERPLSYTASDIGAAHGYAVDELLDIVGEGPRDFEYACDALRRWEQFRLGWLAVFPNDAPADPGTTLAAAAMRLPRTVSTFSVWTSQRQMVEMVRGHSAVPRPERHAAAMAERQRKDFHFEFTTLRFRPIAEYGNWEGRTNIVPT